MKELVRLTISTFILATETFLVKTWSKILHKHIPPYLTIGVARYDSCPTSIGVLEGPLPGDRPGMLLRDRIKNHLLITQGPVPPKIPHQVILMLMPSFLAKSSFKEIGLFLSDWRGTTESFGLPYCFYTVLLPKEFKDVENSSDRSMETKNSSDTTRNKSSDN